MMLKRPDRKPDIKLYDQTYEGDYAANYIEIWFDEMVENFYMDGGSNVISKIKFNENGVLLCLEEDDNDREWQGYEDTGFEKIRELASNWIADKIILGGCMTKAQEEFIALDKKKAEYKKFTEEHAEAVKTLKEEMGIGGHFQDAEGTVYQVEECLGKYQYFDKYEVKRTKREGERAGSLSIKKASELGYDV